MGLVLFVYLLSAITQTNKQASSRTTYNAMVQYLRDRDHNDDNNIKYKN